MADTTPRIWIGGDAVGTVHDNVRIRIGAHPDQIISIEVAHDCIEIRGVGGRPALTIEPMASNAIKVQFREMI
jgi:hypothetical protein